jgi:hypothetical protein
MFGDFKIDLRSIARPEQAEKEPTSGLSVLW